MTVKLPTILVCEDDPVQRELLSLVLGSEGYAVLVAEDGLKALSLAETALPNLILADFMVPGLDGVALGNRLKANPLTAQIPFILSSAAEGFETAGGGDFVADAYLSKPWSWSQLLTLVSYWISRPQSE